MASGFFPSIAFQTRFGREANMNWTLGFGNSPGFWVLELVNEKNVFVNKMTYLPLRVSQSRQLVFWREHKHEVLSTLTPT